MLGEVQKMSKDNRKKVNTKTQKAEKNSTFGKVMITIIVLGIVILLFYNFVFPKVKKSVSHIAAEKAVDVITKNAEKVAETNPEVARVLESMTEEDKEVVTEIIENHIDAGAATEIMGYVQDGDKDALMDYATENLSPEEIAELMKLYGKYAQ